jgi:AcrR family transcriptional regulator
MSTQKELIIKTALDFFSKKGYLKTSIAEIAQVVGLTKGGVYHHMENKEDLLVLIHNEMADAYLDRIEQLVSLNERPILTLKKWICVHLKTIDDYLPHIKVFFTEFRNITDKKRFQEAVKKRNRSFDFLKGIITSGIKAGEFRDDLDPVITTMLLFGMLNWLHMWYRKEGPLSIEDICTQAEKFVFASIATFSSMQEINGWQNS